MAAVDDAASFTFSWLALKLLGRGLYSNPWSALSELVANGLDAGASNVYVYVDARDKSNAIVEVIDNGSGMSRVDIDTYVKVGFDKRKSETLNGLVDSQPKGRKGIGKLAALFLSSHFFLSTRHIEGVTAWELDARNAESEPDEHPQLVSVDATPLTPNDGLWRGLATGTRLTMLGVDLTGYGTQAVNALATRLANQFLMPVSGNPQILLWLRTSNQPASPAYERVEKSIAFGNLAQVAANFSNLDVRPEELATALEPLKIPAKGLAGDVFEHRPEIESIEINPDVSGSWIEVAEDVDLANRTYSGIPFRVTGWIGVHATIDNDFAKANDDRFVKNRFYNPAQIRVYVRGKLASDRLLSQLGLTGTYTNYIEGEITFDLLDEDSLPDIATSNRQDFDETDKRVILLRAIVRPIVRGLIQRRNTLASEIAAQIRSERTRRETASKRHFSEQLRNDLEHHGDIPSATRDELQMVITNKIQGDLSPKQSYRLFISHARTDRTFASFIDELLRSKGAREEEIFFTSRTGSTDVLLDADALSDVVKRNITHDNTLIFYMTSRHFLKSQFCLFEGGAGWATRSVSEYLKLNIEFDSIPGWLTNGRGEAVLLGPNNKIDLTPEIHNYLVEGVLNPMIEHLNRGRDIAGDERIGQFSSASFPSAIDMSKAGKNPADYYDPAIAEHWGTIVEGQLPQYLKEYLTP